MSDKEELECSFCKRKKDETNLLIAGVDAHICDKCIEQAHGIVLEESILDVFKRGELSQLKNFTRKIIEFVTPYLEKTKVLNHKTGLDKFL